MNKRIKDIIIGLILGTIISTTGFSFADNIKEYILYKADYKIIIGSHQYDNLDAPVLNYKGLTYVPLKAVGDLLNSDIKWDTTTQQVEIKNKEKEEESVTKNVYKSKLKDISTTTLTPTPTPINNLSKGETIMNENNINKNITTPITPTTTTPINNIINEQQTNNPNEGIVSSENGKLFLTLNNEKYMTVYDLVATLDNSYRINLQKNNKYININKNDIAVIKDIPVIIISNRAFISINTVNNQIIPLISK